MSKRRRSPYARADSRTRAAKAKGYPARSIFKLEEIDERYHLLRPGQHVLDLGAAPGSWARYAANRIGKAGRVLAVDRKEISEGIAPNVSILQGDAMDLALLRSAGLDPFDIVLSDMAPNTTGAKFTDQTRSFELFMGALDVALALSRPGAHFVGKIFMSGDFPVAQKRVRATYSRMKITKPAGTRSNSSEIYVIGFERRAGP